MNALCVSLGKGVVQIRRGFCGVRALVWSFGTTRDVMFDGEHSALGSPVLVT